VTGSQQGIGGKLRGECGLLLSTGMDASRDKRRQAHIITIAEHLKIVGPKLDFAVRRPTEGLEDAHAAIVFGDIAVRTRVRFPLVGFCGDWTLPSRQPTRKRVGHGTRANWTGRDHRSQSQGRLRTASRSVRRQFSV
jgi:hypothetical protein